MKKRFLGILGVAALGALSLASCAKDEDVFHIYAWNQEFQGFFNKYVSDEKTDKAKVYHLDGKKVKWTINPSDDGVYQTKLDAALKKNATEKSKSKRVDMFLAEADYIGKYVNSDASLDVKSLGVTNFENIYQYTEDTATDANGKVKGVSFQCCPAGVIYRRSIAKAVLGTDDPEQVQAAMSNWNDFRALAADMKEAGYKITASFAEDYRAYSNNVSKSWINDKSEIQFDDQIVDWMVEAKQFMDAGYTLDAGIWDDACTAEMFKTGKTFCYFGPAWYYNFCMGNAQDEKDGCFGDWALCEGPAKYFWGGTWMLAANGTDDQDLIKKTMNAFINDKEICKKLVKNDGQFSNNKVANQEVSDEYDAAGSGNAFLGGQNDTKVYLGLAGGISNEFTTYYDQFCNEGLQKYYVDYLKGTTQLKTAINNFLQYMNQKAPSVVTSNFDVDALVTTINDRLNQEKK